MGVGEQRDEGTGSGVGWGMGGAYLRKQAGIPGTRWAQRSDLEGKGQLGAWFSHAQDRVLLIPTLRHLSCIVANC